MSGLKEFQPQMTRMGADGDGFSPRLSALSEVNFL